MFDIAPTELLLVAFVALVVIGPKDLPKAMRVFGYWVGRARGVARQFRSGFDSMVREAELEEMEKRWAAENERIMREHPPTPPNNDPDPEDIPDRGLPADHQPDGSMADEESTSARADAEHVDKTAQPVMVEKPQVAPAMDTGPSETKSGRSEGASS